MNQPNYKIVCPYDAVLYICPIAQPDNSYIASYPKISQPFNDINF